MKLYYIGVSLNREFKSRYLTNVNQIHKSDRKPAIQLCAEYELGEFSRFTRNEYKNFMTMFSKTVAERTSAGQRVAVEEQGARNDLLLPFRILLLN